MPDRAVPPDTEGRNGGEAAEPGRAHAPAYSGGKGAQFIDRVMLHATAGAGGNGCASVHREKFKPLGGPDGGNGGRGGSVVLVVDPGVHTLLDFHHRPHALARSGKQGQGGFKAGANAEDLELHVPDGTV